MRIWLENVYLKNKTALTNAWYLSIFQMLSLVFPLITYPYIIKVIGDELYGSILLGQGVAYFLSAFVSYGFNLSITRDISLNKEDIVFVSKIYTATILCKSLIFIPVIIMFGIYGYLTVLPEKQMLFFLCAGPLVYELLFPTWLFQGLEKMKYITVVTVISRFILLLSIFSFVKEEADAKLFALINISFYIASGLFAQYVAFSSLAVRFVRVKLSFCLQAFKNGYAIFLSTIFIAMKDRLNVIIVGSIFGPQQVVIYDLAMKIVSVISIPQNIIFSAFYPSVVKDRDIGKIKKLGALITFINTIIVIGVFAILPYAYSYLIGESYPDVYNLYILSSTIILIGISGVMGRFTMLAFGYDKLLARTTIVNCVVYFMSILVYSLLSIEKSLIDFSILIFLIYSSELLIRFFGLRFSGLYNEKDDN
ncbi:oligosaccharide flippase family protein [Aeromonas veronii]|uniref:oligosaccharide flippase family protein n=1 Tax=Aeromonas veronii TaxID=654 RepID=UPI003D249FCF